MTPKKPVTARLFALLAREAPVGVILRRGPSKWVQLIKWNTDTDTFEVGQWLKARVDFESCDLSPDGKLFVYFAYKGGSWRQEPESDTYYRDSWTAISKPPYFTALALWPIGGSYGGGGHFRDNKSLWLSCGEATKFHPNHPPIGLKVIPNGQGLIDSKYIDWELIQIGRNVKESNDSEYSAGFRATVMQEGWSLRFMPPRTWQKQVGSLRLVKQRLGYPTFRTFVDEYNVLETSTHNQFALGRIQWADFDQKKRLVLAKAGKLFSAAVVDGELAYTELADFNANQPEAIESPDWAKKW